jgi:RecA/RadA recombinase
LEKLATLEAAFPPGLKILRASEMPPPRKVSLLSTGVGRLDALLSGGLPRGRLVEIAGRRSSGRFAVALSALSAATRAGENAAFVDLGDHLDPQEARAAGADLARLLWVRPRRLKEAVRAAEIVLSAGFPLVVADLGATSRGRGVPEASWVRLARSAEGHGSALLLLTAHPVAGAAAEAAVTLHRRRASWSGSGDSPRLLCGIDARFTLEKRRGVRPGRIEEMRFGAGA